MRGRVAPGFFLEVLPVPAKNIVIKKLILQRIMRERVGAVILEE
jgi:hypothetical protein